METKKWYESKLVWVGIISTLIAILTLLGEFLQNGNFEPVAITTFTSGILVIILRIWFTNTQIKR